MILINLLPHREAARKKKREEFIANMGVSAVIALLIVAGIWAYYGVLQMHQDNRNSKLEAEIRILDKQLESMSSLEKEITGLMARQKAVENLQADRNLPVHWLEDLARLTPPGIYLTSVKQKGLDLTVNGVTVNNDRFGDFIKIVSDPNSPAPVSTNAFPVVDDAATANRKNWILDPRWVGELKSVDLSILPGEPVRRMYTFSLEFKLRRESEDATSAGKV